MSEVTVERDTCLHIATDLDYLESDPKGLFLQPGISVRVMHGLFKGFRGVVVRMLPGCSVVVAIPVKGVLSQ